MSGEIKGFDCDKVKLKFWDDIDSRIYRIDEEFEKYENMVAEIEKELQIKEKNIFFRHTDKE